MDDASADPVGTVRRTIGLIETALVKTTSVSLPWRRLDYTLSSDGLNFENLGGFSDEQAARFPVIGAVPGTPAAAGLLAAPTPTVDAIERIRQIIADHCFGPHVDSVAELRALEIAAACTDDMVDEGLLAASAAQPIITWHPSDGPTEEITPGDLCLIGGKEGTFRVASPAAPADDEAAVERMAYAMWQGGIFDPARHQLDDWRDAATAALAALREGQQK